MSTMPSHARGRSWLQGTLPRPRLTIVPRVSSRAPRVPFVILVVLVLGAGLIGLLLLNTALQRGAYELSDLRSSSDALSIKEQSLHMEVAVLRQPRHVAEAALALGMVRHDSPAFLDLGSGRVTGAATPAEADDIPIVDVRPGTPAAHSSKSLPLVAGAANSASTGVERVQPTGADTRPTSQDPPTGQATNNSSNSG